MKVRELTDWLEGEYPGNMAEDWDNVGLLVGDDGQEVHHVFLALDLTEAVLEDSVSYVWSRKAASDTDNRNITELSREKTYSVTQDDVGSKILLTITGLEDKGYTGSLKAETTEITAVSQEPAQTEENNSQETEVLPEEPSGRR